MGGARKVDKAFARGIRFAAGAALIASAIAGPAGFAQSVGRPGGSPGAVHGAVDRNFLIGRWSDRGDCAIAVAFVADGTFATAEGDGGVWNLQGDALTLTGEGGTRTVTIIPIDRDTMEVVDANGAHDRSTRCAAHFEPPRLT
jgi:hypothetical protein